MQTLYIEDLIILLYTKIVNYEVKVQHQDIGPIANFNSTIDSGKLLTRKQGQFILQLLRKYKTYIASTDYNIDTVLDAPSWKNEFRVIDTTKYIYLKTDDAGATWLHVKFPFSFKDQFAKEFFKVGTDPTIWDAESVSRKAKISSINLVSFIETAEKHGFEIETTVLDAAAYVEELWNNDDQLVPYSVIDNEQVELVNANRNAAEYWAANKTGSINADLFLAKQMGFMLKNSVVDSTMKRIATTDNTGYWFSKQDEFFRFIDNLNVWPVVIVLDRNPDPKIWVQSFVENFSMVNFTKDDIRVCFRPSNSDADGPEFNSWLKEENLNKPVADGKLFICQHKPQKWMFNKDFELKIFASNSIYPSVNNITSALISSHPNVFYFDEIKPSPKRNLKIVSL